MKNRQKEIIKTGTYGIATNIIVAGGKAIVGVASGSMAIIMDAINNLTDALSSIITIVGVKLASLPPDDKHPFGYGRMEYFAAVIIAAMILIAGGTSLVEAVEGILDPTDQEYSTFGLIIIAITIIIKFVLGFYTKRKGKQLSSDSLISSGTECIYDCIVSISTLVSAGVMVAFNVSLDCWLAAIISCLIIKAGIEMLMSPITELLGKRNDPELTGEIKQRVRSIDGVRGVFDVVLHNYGPSQQIGALHVEVNDTMPASELHKLTRRIQKLVRTEFGILVTVGFYAHHQDNSEVASEEQRIRKHVCSCDGVLGMHGFYVSDEDKMISFDVVYSVKMKHPLSLRDNLTEWLQDKYAGYDISIGLDRNYSE